jgi:hypothetical protein
MIEEMKRIENDKYIITEEDIMRILRESTMPDSDEEVEDEEDDQIVKYEDDEPQEKRKDIGRAVAGGGQVRNIVQTPEPRKVFFKEDDEPEEDDKVEYDNEDLQDDHEDQGEEPDQEFSSDLKAKESKPIHEELNEKPKVINGSDNQKSNKNVSETETAHIQTPKEPVQDQSQPIKSEATVSQRTKPPVHVAVQPSSVDNPNNQSFSGQSQGPKESKYSLKKRTPANTEQS